MASRTKARLNNLNDRAREVGLSERLEQSDIDALKEFYAYTCLKCGFNPAISPDHVKPLSKGGSNTVDNLQLLCDSCNKSKGDDETDYRNGRILTREIVADLSKSQTQQDKREKIDWAEIEFDYVTSLSTLRELAAKYKVSLRQLGGVCSAEDWVAKRQNYSNKIATGIIAEVEAANVREGFSAYKATFVMLRRAFDDYMSEPTPEKLKAIDSVLTKGLTLEGYEVERKGIVHKDWRDSANPANVTDIQQYATDAAAGYFGGDTGSDSEQGAGWTD